MADSIREALTKAVEAADKPATPTPEPTADVAAAPAPTDSNTKSGVDAQADTSAAATAGPASGEPAKEAAKPDAVASKPAADSSKPTTAGGGSDTSQPPPSPADQAPGSWKAAEKAEWDKIPANARAAIKRREAEASRALTASTEARRHTDEYQKVLHPFEPLMQGRGITDPLNQVIKPILQIRAALEIGSPQQKAALVANMVRDFGIDIALLDSAITNHIRNPGAAPAPVQAAPPPSLRSNPELQPLFAIAERFQAATRAKATEAIASVQDLPHYEELREDMAEILERFDAQGKTLTIREAYDRAATMNGLTPTPSAPAQVSPSEAAAILARSRKAASSVSGAPSTSPGKKPTTLREQIEAAVVTHSS